MSHSWDVLHIYKTLEMKALMLKHTEGNRRPEVLDLEDIAPGMRFSAEKF